VIGLEAGGWLDARDFAADEISNNFRGWPKSVQKANREIPTHRPNEKAPYSPRFPLHPIMNVVGGTSLHYWAQSWRLNPRDFKTRSATSKQTNVVNRWGFSHEVPNLGILGASVMGTSGSHNPTLTAQAPGWRTAAYLTKSWKAIAIG
jgi:choline dehydrogenase-like flavoprotein